MHALGLRTLRYPVLWEQVAPHGLARADWSWADERLHRLRALGIRPIVGLVHHGSGPSTTSLVQSSFIEGLAEFAAAVAQRYPWIDAYTPVNEPLTTARFAALYGHWYPHQSGDRAFVQAIINETLATRAAMQAIRQVAPHAQLVQTEDIGLIRSTSRLKYQADFENARRWLSLDLLTGRVDAAHPIWWYLQRARADEDALASLRGEPCPPDIIGLNYYLTSDRYLDHRAWRHPEQWRGGNGRHTYADLEAVRVRHIGLAGHERHLLDAWRRYQRPLAITEVHAGCTREEQARWLLEAWHGAQAAREAGATVQAITAWALFGSYDWNSLVTRETGHYESGAFDVRSPEPRRTLLADVVSQLARGEMPADDLLESPGWWRRAIRYGGKTSDGYRGRPLLITGGRGTLGRALAHACAIRGLAHVVLTRQELDIADPTAVAQALAEHRPWAVLNAAGYVDVDRAEREPDRCHRENAHGPEALAIACAAMNVRLLTYSSDLVFDGASPVPYVESDATAPLNVYGRSKADAEARVLAALHTALVIRTSAFFGPEDDYNFVTMALRHCADGRPFCAAQDVVISPTYVPELANVSLDLLLDGAGGVWHLANEGAITWSELAMDAAERLGLDRRLIEPVPSTSLGWSAPRPAFSAITSERGRVMQSVDHAMDAYCCAIRPSMTKRLQSVA